MVESISKKSELNWDKGCRRSDQTCGGDKAGLDDELFGDGIVNRTVQFDRPALRIAANIATGALPDIGIKPIFQRSLGDPDPI